MNKYINAEQLKKEFPHNNDWDYPVNTNSYVVELIDSTSYIDLVYCKDCIYRPLVEDPDDEPCKFNLIAPAAGRHCPCLVDDGWYSWMPPDNFYCAYGKTSEGEWSMLVYEKIGFDGVRWSDNIEKFSNTISIDIPYEDVAERSTDLKLIGLQLIFEHNDLNEGE